MKPFILLSFFGIAINAHSQPLVTGNSKVEKVTVFRSQAQVERSFHVSIPAGLANLVLEKISPNLVDGSIEVKVPDGVEMISVNSKNEYLDVPEKPGYVIELEDSLTSLQESLAEIAADKEAINWQRDLLQSNKSIGGANLGVKAEELEDMLTIYQKKLQEFKVDLIRLNRREKSLQLARKAIEKQLNEYRQGLVSGTNQILVQVKSARTILDARLEIRYLVHGVSWQPFYDLRVKDATSPIELQMKAHINQHTGENWQQVKMRVTTTDPNSGGVKPELQTTFLNYRQTVPNYRGARAESKAARAENYLLKETIVSDAAPTQTLLSLDFDVAGTVSLPSDGKAHMIELTSLTLPATYGYASVPKLDKEVFVTANVPSNDLISQVNGEANLYFDGTFTGKTYLSGSSGDSLLLTLGKDRRIIARREKVKDLCSKSFFGSNRKESTTYELTLTNSGTEKIQVKLEDQYPVSTNSEIEVKLIDAGGALVQTETGHLLWNLSLTAKQTVKVRFSFEVSYPSGKVLSEY